MEQFICEIWVPKRYGVGGDWLPAENTDWGTQDAAVEEAAARENEGWTARITRRIK
jgi:hypothetical protein